MGSDTSHRGPVKSRPRHTLPSVWGDGPASVSRRPAPPPPPKSASPPGAAAGSPAAVIPPAPAPAEVRPGPARIRATLAAATSRKYGPRGPAWSSRELEAGAEGGAKWPYRRALSNVGKGKEAWKGGGGGGGGRAAGKRAAGAAGGVQWV